MEYSAESLSKFSNISVRTLHYYDEIGLLKPALRMVNATQVLRNGTSFEVNGDFIF